MNKAQKDYLEAKAYAQILREQMEENEAAYLKMMGIVNIDGSIPKHVWEIIDDATFDRACAAFEESPLNIRKQSEEADKRLRVAEDALIDFALSLLPKAYKKERDVLERNRKRREIREKLLDYASRLDTKTVG